MPEFGLEFDVLAGSGAIDPRPHVGLEGVVVVEPRRLPERPVGYLGQVGVDVLHRRVVDIADRPVGVEEADEDVRVVEDGLVAAFLPLQFAFVFPAFGDVRGDAEDGIGVALPEVVGADSRLEDVRLAVRTGQLPRLEPLGRTGFEHRLDVCHEPVCDRVAEDFGHVRPLDLVDGRPVKVRECLVREAVRALRVHDVQDVGQGIDDVPQPLLAALHSAL